MTIPVYNTGTVSVSVNGTIVSGGGTTIWGNNVREGDWIVIDGAAITMVLAVTDDDNLVIPEWKFGAKTNVEYAIYQNYSARSDVDEVARDLGKLVAALNNEGFIWFVGPAKLEPDPSNGDEGQWAYQPSTGKQWHKEGGAWVFDGIFKGFGTPAPYDNGKTYSLNDVATLDGASYVWINQTSGVGHAPPNVTYWAVLAARGAQGEQGEPATIEVGTVTTLPAGSAATVVDVGVPGASVLNFGIPKGEDGEDGSGVGDLVAANNLSELTNKPLALATLGAIFTPQVRVSLTQGVPVPTSDVSGATTIYVMPFQGDLLPIYDATLGLMMPRRFAEIAFALTANSGFAGYHQSGENFNIYAAWVSGAVVIGTGPAWTTTDSEGTGTGTNEIEVINGIRVNKVTITLRTGVNSGDTISVPARQATKLATFNAVANGQAANTSTKRLLCNVYNVALTPFNENIEPSATWNAFTSGAFQQSNNNTNSCASVLFAESGNFVSATARAVATNNGAGVEPAAAGIGIDSVTVNSAQQTPFVGVTSDRYWNTYSIFEGYLTKGLRSINLLESAAGSSTKGFAGQVQRLSGKALL